MVGVLGDELGAALPGTDGAAPGARPTPARGTQQPRESPPPRSLLPGDRRPRSRDHDLVLGPGDAGLDAHGAAAGRRPGCGPEDEGHRVVELSGTSPGSGAGPNRHLVARECIV